MHHDALRLLILSKLADGRLPMNRLPKIWGGPGNGEICDACERIVTKDESVIEGTPVAAGRPPLHLHARCFWIWETERRPKVASDHLTTASVTYVSPRIASPTSIISSQMNGFGVTRSYDQA